MGARSLFSFNTLDDELGNATVEVCIYSEAHPTLAKLNSEQVAVRITPMARLSLAGRARNVATVSCASLTVN